MAKRPKRQSTTRPRIKTARTNPRGRSTRSRRGPESPAGHTLLSNRIIFELYRAGTALSIGELVKLLSARDLPEPIIEHELRLLVRLDRVEHSRKNRFSLAKKSDLLEGVVVMNPAGFGFATGLKSSSGARLPDKDLYLSRTHLATARHGDRVLLRIIYGGPRRRDEAEIVGIFERMQKTLVGYYHQQGDHGVAEPEDPRFPASIHLNVSGQNFVGELRDGDAVIVALDTAESETAQLRGHIVEILGDPQRLAVQIRMVVEKHRLIQSFSPEAQAEAEQVVADPGAANREDLREILHVTIDGADAKDFDDAVAVEKLRNGYRLYVSIADVSAYVRAGSCLDREAYERGTSVYFPTTVIPMLPENISNNLCSLLPHQDRLTVTAILDFNHAGKLFKKRFVRSIIHSHNRFTYQTVKQIVVDQDKEVRNKFKPFLKALQWAAELATILHQVRVARGSITLTIPEPDIQLDAELRVAAVERMQRSFANQIVEEFMLAANEAVARTFAERDFDTLYRIHEEPDPDKIKDFISVAETLALKLPMGATTSRWYNQLLHQVQGTAREQIVNNLLLRTMQQARYQHDNTGHFGLGAEFYTHFTSPIRRYPDLIVHRLLCRMIIAGSSRKDKAGKAGPYRSLQEAGLHLSDRERLAITAERDLADRLKCQFMQQRLGDRFQAVVSSITDSLFFVDLVEQLISGAVLLSSLTDDYYIHDWRKHRLIGDISGRIIQIGDLVEVVAVEVEADRGRIFFTLEGNSAKELSSKTKHHK